MIDARLAPMGQMPAENKCFARETKSAKPLIMRPDSVNFMESKRSVRCVNPAHLTGCRAVHKLCTKCTQAVHQPCTWTVPTVRWAWR